MSFRQCIQQKLLEVLPFILLVENTCSKDASKSAQRRMKRRSRLFLTKTSTPHRLAVYLRMQQTYALRCFISGKQNLLTVQQVNSWQQTLYNDRGTA